MEGKEESKKRHKLCEESLEKLNDLGISAEELLSILDELSKQGVSIEKLEFHSL